MQLHHAHYIGTLKENRVGLQQLLQPCTTMPDSYADEILDQNLMMAYGTNHLTGANSNSNIFIDNTCQ